MIPAPIRQFGFPLLWLLALPLFALWFGAHARDRYDADVLAAAEQYIANDRQLDAAGRAEALAFYRETPASAVCADTSPAGEEARVAWAGMCSDLGYFAWIRWLAWVSLGTAALMVSAATGSVLLARQGSGMLVPAFFAGWNVLRAGSAVQIVTQGALGVLLSYWVSAYFLNFYAPKLIVMVALLALFAVGAALVALFQRVDLAMPVDAGEITEDKAPALWARVREIAAATGTAPPDRILAGIDDNFYVTEGEIIHGGERRKGRTLYVSLSLLRSLARPEADAVLAHEMAHFSGGDTARSRRLTPGLSRAGNLLNALDGQVFGLPALHTLGTFFEQFILAMAQDTRDRELRADALSARVTSPNAMAHALLKVGAYSSYRGRVERSLFDANEQHGSLALADRVRVGFDSYARSENLIADLRDAHVPHPTDSHPPMVERIAALGLDLPVDTYEGVVLAEVEGSWVDDIAVAEEIEQRMWAEYEARFLAAHEFNLAVRYVPNTVAELAIVLKHFPSRTFTGSGQEVVRVTHTGLTGEGWPDELGWGAISSLNVVEAGMFRGNVLNVLFAGGSREVPLKPHGDAGAQELLNTIDLYFRRHHAMLQHQLEQAAQA